MHRCETCETSFDGRADARFCSGRCRAANGRRLRAVAFELLMRQTRAIQTGADVSVLDEIAAEAERLLPSGV